MKTLYQYTLCPFSRKVRITLNEKKLIYEKILEKTWEKRDAFFKLNTLLEVPVLVDDDFVLSGSIAIDEYLETEYPDVKLIGNSKFESAEIRKYVAFFDQKFYAEVTRNLVFEKYIKKYFDKYSGPNSISIREGIKYLNDHLEYLSWLVESREWISGENFSLADITAAAHISVLDYINEIPWNKFPEVKMWYLKIKSRPSFREILDDKIYPITPPEHYKLIDF